MPPSVTATVLPQSEFVAAGDLGRIGRLHDNQAAQFEIGDEVHLACTLLVDVHRRIDDIEAAALQRHDQPLELHVHRIGRNSELFAQQADHVDVEARQLSVPGELERRKGRGNAVGQGAFFDQGDSGEIGGERGASQEKRQDSADKAQA